MSRDPRNPHVDNPETRCEVDKTHAANQTTSSATNRKPRARNIDANDPNYTPGERIAYTLGKLRGYNEASEYGVRLADLTSIMVRTAAENETRAAAFGAIRRAAEIARGHDESSDDYLEYMHETAQIHESIAAEIRCAIRAAIGSEKT